MNIQTGQIEETDAEFATGLAHLQAYAAREGHSQVPPDYIEERITNMSNQIQRWVKENWRVDATGVTSDHGRVATCDAEEAPLLAAAPALEEALERVLDWFGADAAPGSEEREVTEIALAALALTATPTEVKA